MLLTDEHYFGALMAVVMMMECDIEAEEMAEDVLIVESNK